MISNILKTTFDGVGKGYAIAGAAAALAVTSAVTAVALKAPGVSGVAVTAAAGAAITFTAGTLIVGGTSILVSVLVLYAFTQGLKR